MSEGVIKACTDAGIAVFMSLGVLGLCGWLVKHIATGLTQGMERLATTVDKVVDSVEKHDTKADERGKYVREEHKQMIEVLGRINGYTNGYKGDPK